MHHFEYRQGELTCEGVTLRDIAAQVGTPYYLYSRATLEHHYQVVDTAFGTIPHLTAYSVKANSNLAVLGLMAQQGAGADIVSGGELFRALKAGIPADRIVFSGVGKQDQEIAEALAADILMFHVESRAELLLINRVAEREGKVARITLRVNPNVDPKTHRYIATGLKESKFGIAMDEAIDAFVEASTLPHVRVVGVDQHIGSQITEAGPFLEAVERVAELITRLRAKGLTIDYLDIGGGIGIPYDDHVPPSPAMIADSVLPVLKSLNITLILEPGRVIAGNAGVFVTQVLRVKETGEKHFVVVDGAMNDLMRPSLYDAFHRVLPVVEGNQPEILADVVGPVCESGDFLAKGRKLPTPAEGDLLAVMSAGAYGFTMASNYNSRPRVAEVIVDGDTFHVVRQREGYDDLIRGESIPWP